MTARHANKISFEKAHYYNDLAAKAEMRNVLSVSIVVEEGLFIILKWSLY